MYLGILTNSREESLKMAVQSQISDLTTFVLQDTLDNWFLFHFIQIHPPSIAIVLENYQLFFCSQGLGSGITLK